MRKWLTLSWALCVLLSYEETLHATYREPPIVRQELEETLRNPHFLPSFATLTQRALLQGEDFANAQKKIKSASETQTSDRLITYKTYLKLWPRVLGFYVPASKNANNAATLIEGNADDLEEMKNVYSAAYKLSENDPFQKAQVCRLRALADEFLSKKKDAMKRAQTKGALQSILLHSDKSLRLEASADIQYWAWRHRDFIPQLLEEEQWPTLLKAAANFERSDGSPSAKAQYSLALQKEGILLSDGERHSLLKQAALNYRKAQLYLDYCTLKEHLQKDPSQLLKFYRKLAEEGYPVSQFLFGILLWNTEQNEDKAEAFSWLLKAAQKGMSFAEKKLEDMWLHQETPFYRLCEDLTCIESPVAQYYLGLLKEDKAYHEKDKKIQEADFMMATAHYAQAAASYYPPALRALGLMYWYGWGAKENGIQALFYFKQAAAHDTLALASLAMSYGYGKGVETDLNKAQQLHDLYLTNVRASDNGQEDSASPPLKQLRRLAFAGSGNRALVLGKMCEEGKGIAFGTSKEWLYALEQAEKLYKLAALYDLPDASSALERVKQTLSALDKVKDSYLLSKLIKGATITFTLQHPLFNELTQFIQTLEKCSRSAQQLGAYIMQELVALPPEEAEANRVALENLISLIKSEDFQKQFAQEEPEAEKVTQLFETLINKSRQAKSIGSKEQASLYAFFEQHKSYIYKKIEAGIKEKLEKGEAQPLSPQHPLFNEFMEFIGHIGHYTGSIPEHGGHLIQQLLEFPSEELAQARALIESLLDLVTSNVFKHGKPNEEEEDIQERRLEKLIALNDALAKTLKPSQLLSPKDLPTKLKVAPAMIQDPRIAVFNAHFHQLTKPFNVEEFRQTCTSLLNFFDELQRAGEIAKETLYDEESKEYATRESLKRFLYYTEDSIEKIPNRFANRLIKIYPLLLDEDKFGKGFVAAQLSSWAIAGAGGHCRTRAEKETEEFYNRNLVGGSTLEQKVAKCLADLRKELLEKFVPASEGERLHQLMILEQKVGKKLALVGDAKNFNDPHEKVGKAKYHNMTPQFIKDILLKGDKTYKIDIVPGQGYNNPDILVKHTLRTINLKPIVVKGTNIAKPLITCDEIKKRFDKDYPDEAWVKASEYYNDEDELTEMSEKGAQALLLSLGYLEKDLPPQDEKKQKTKTSLF